MALVLQRNVDRTQRVARRPEHTFQLRQQAFQIQPFFIAPVLAGETMKSLLLQARVVSDPVKSALIGWWLEYFVFYVKLRDLDDRASFEAMVLDPNYNAAALQSAADVRYYHGASLINYSQKCLKRVVEEYFRDEGETWNANVIDTMPVASVVQQQWLRSVRNDADYISVDLDVDSADANTTIQASEVEAALRQWQLMRSQNMTEITFEEYLETFGVRGAVTEATHKPELVRYIRDWTYPANTVDPTSGTPRSALSWKVAETADKDRFFKEPGFLFGVCVARPKVYRQNQSGAIVGIMDGALDWLPALLHADPQSSLQKRAALSAPLTSNTDAYWVDLRDVFLYGDQFINFSLAETDANIVSLPTAGLTKRYVTSTDTDELFVTPASLKYIRSDGIVNLTILGRQVGERSRQ